MVYSFPFVVYTETVVDKKENKKKIKITTKRVVLALLVFAAVVFAAYVVIAQSLASKVSESLTVSEAQVIVDNEIKGLPKAQAKGAVFISENMSVKVNDVEVGNEKNLILDCEITSYNLYDTISDNLNAYFEKAYKLDRDRTKNKLPKANSTIVRQHMQDYIVEDIKNAEKKAVNATLYLYEVDDGQFELFFSDEIINVLFGGYTEALSLVNESDTVLIGDEEISIKNNIPYKTGIVECFTLNNYDSKKPDTSIPAVKWLNSVGDEFYRNFLETEKGRPRYMNIVDGLINTLKVTALALIIGIVIGFVVAVIRVTNDTTGKLDFAAWICKIYLSVMRGTPLMIQLLIIYFVVLLPAGVGSLTSAVVCFGLNSGAYVSEIVRGGIMSVDKGQTEAGRSLGFTYIQTMYYIVLPQAFKAVLPSLANEFITLLKETSVAFYIGVADLTLGGLRIRSVTYSSFMPLVAVAIVYLILVLGLSKLVSILERRLRKGDNR